MTKNWKKTGYLIPDVIEPEENICICVPVPKDWGHINAFLGQITELAKWLTWEKDGTDSALRSARRWMEITQCVIDEVNCKMTSGCGCGNDNPTNTRINPETGLYEVSYDGGVTWQPDPGNDPRSSGTVFPPIPGNPGDDLRCQAANSALGFLQAVQAAELEGLENNATIAEFATMVLGFLAAIGFAFAFVPTAIAALLYFVVNFFGHQIAADFEAAFDEDKWDELFCILYCNMEDDGSFTEAGWLAVKDELDNDISDYGLGWMFNHINLIGTVGLTNAARSSYPGTRECDECPCEEGWCYEFNFLTDDYDFEVTFGTWTLGVGFVGTTAGTGKSIFLHKPFAMTELTHVEIDMTFTPRGNVVVRWGVNDTVTPVNVLSGTYTWDGMLTDDDMTINPSAGASQGTSVTMTRLLLRGNGTNPFGDDNCE
jgi:hypothetical protein